MRLLAGVACVCIGFLAAADDLRPLVVEINEEAGHRYLLRVRTPPRVAPDNVPQIVFPEACNGESARARALIKCARAPYGDQLSIRYPRREVPNPTVVRVNLEAGESYTVALSSGVREFRMPWPEDVATVARQYAWLGAEHIWIGFDHLLFLVCLIWIAGAWKRIVITITGFTLAHSVTLALSALEIVRLPVPPIEAVIALSVLFLAGEVTKGPRRNLTWRYPIAVSSAFGLLHGLGFAAVLNEIGLPAAEVITGLVFFNIGVEIGQVIFALAVILLLRGIALLWKEPSAGEREGAPLARKKPSAPGARGCPSQEKVREGAPLGWSKRLPGASASGNACPMNDEAEVAGYGALLARNPALQRGRVPAGYAVGCIAAYWLIDRLAAFA